MPTIRLANLLRLSHHMSVDLYVDKVIRHARLIVVRLLGGRSYWPYGVEQIEAACRAANIACAFLPGDDKPDADLMAASTLPAEAVERLWRYLANGGRHNAAQFLNYAASLIGHATEWREPVPIPPAGLYPPGRSLDDVRAAWKPEAPTAALVFYRALVQAGDTAVVDALVDGLAAAGLNGLPLHVASLKDPLSAATVSALLAEAPPDVIVNCTGFAVASPGKPQDTPFAAADCVVLQAVLSGGTETAWRDGTHGLSPRDIAMNVALPEVDGRVLARAVSFKGVARFDEATQCDIVAHVPVPDRVAFTAQLAARWAALRRKAPGERRVAVVLANYPNRDGRLGNGVGLDTPAGTMAALRALAAAGYRVEDLPSDGQDLIRRLLEGPTNALTVREERESIALPDYYAYFHSLPQGVRDAVTARWGSPEQDPHFRPGSLSCGRFALGVIRFGNIAVGIQPARGYNIDPASSYHDPDLVPPHNYLAFYAWLHDGFRADAVVHMGKHGNLEWLPGKSLALSAECFPEAALGPLPNLYPFIVNDPGEGTQGKRRAQAVIIDHLTPPLTRAESYGPLRQLEQLVDEYYDAAQLDPRRLAPLKREIASLVRVTGLDEDCGIRPEDDADAALKKLDNHLCELKELQIRDGLHVFGVSPVGDQLTDLLVALVRTPRGARPEDASLLRALARDLGLDFDPLDCDLGAPWLGGRPDLLAHPPQVIPPRAAWGEGFPEVTVQQPSDSAVRIKDHPDYAAAKAGDEVAAFRVVNDVVDLRKVEAIRAALSGRRPTIVPVVAEEASGRNKLPHAYASLLGGLLGLPREWRIVQVSKSRRTGTDTQHRLTGRPEFDGPVTAGQTYLLVDDHIALGGTLAELRSHIELRGGRVVLASTLTSARPRVILPVTAERVSDLRFRHVAAEEWWKRTFGYGFDALTNGEAAALLADGALERLRNRLAARGVGGGGPTPGPDGGGTPEGQDRRRVAWRTTGDTVERLELLARALVAGTLYLPDAPHTAAVLDWLNRHLRPAVEACGTSEIAGLLTGLAGRFVAPGPSGAPTRGRPDVLPTGRNFFSVDTRTVPTPAAWHLGWASATLLLERHAQEHGEWPRTIAVTAWGTSNMRTGGDDIAQALALLGVRPQWETASRRVTGFEIMPASVLDRPRVDVTLRVSGFFRDAFPGLIDLFDSAVRAVAALDEPAEVNPLAARVRREAAELEAKGLDAQQAQRRAGYRVFGSKPGAYGAGLQALVDEKGWRTDADLASAYVAWGGWAYGAGTEGEAEHGLFERRLTQVEAVVQNQDNREHDLLDSDDYYQFEGGMTAAVRLLSGAQPAVYHPDHSRPETPRIRTLDEEIARVVRGRAANPKWIAGVMRHGYKGAFEMAATVDYLFAFAATARAVKPHHFDALLDAYLRDDAVRDFLAEANPDALREMAARFQEAIDRGLWRPRANDVHELLAGLM